MPKDMKHRMCLIGAVLSIMASIIGCHPKEERLPLFKDAALQDSLQCFFDRIDSIAFLDVSVMQQNNTVKVNLYCFDCNWIHVYTNDKSLMDLFTRYICDNKLGSIELEE